MLERLEHLELVSYGQSQILVAALAKNALTLVSLCQWAGRPIPTQINGEMVIEEQFGSNREDEFRTMKVVLDVAGVSHRFRFRVQQG